VRTLTNGRLLRRRSRIGALYLGGSTFFLLAGLVLSLTQTSLTLPVLLGMLMSLGIGLVLLMLNHRYLQRWGPRWRQDGALIQALRSLDDRHYFLVAPAESLPDYLLIGPMGIIVIIPSPVRGVVSWSGGEWRHQENRGPVLRALAAVIAPRPTVGNPSSEAQAGVDATRRMLAQRRVDASLQAQVPIQSLVVFTDPNVKLSVQGSPVTALLLRSLRGHLRHTPRALNATEIEEILDALTPADLAR
jgi:hypothetical protein